MPIAFNDLGSASTSTDDTSFSTGTISPTNGALVFYIACGVAASNVMPTLSGWSATWDTVVTAGGDGTDVTDRIIKVFRTVSDGTSGALTCDFGATTQARFFRHVIEVTGFDDTGSNGANAIGATVSGERNGGGGAISTYSLDINTTRTGSGIFGAIHTSNDSAVTEGTGYTEYADETQDAQVMQTQGRTTADTNCDWSFSSADKDVVAVTFEIKIPFLGGNPIFLSNGAMGLG